MLQAQAYLCHPTGANGLGPSLLQCRFAGWEVSSSGITFPCIFYSGCDLWSQLNLQCLWFKLVVGPQHNEGSHTSGSTLFLVWQMIQKVLLEKHGTLESHASTTLLWVNVKLQFHLHPWLGSGSWLYFSIIFFVCGSHISYFLKAIYRCYLYIGSKHFIKMCWSAHPTYAGNVCIVILPSCVSCSSFRLFMRLSDPRTRSIAGTFLK